MRCHVAWGCQVRVTGGWGASKVSEGMCNWSLWVQPASRASKLCQKGRATLSLIAVAAPTLCHHGKYVRNVDETRSGPKSNIMGSTFLRLWLFVCAGEWSPQPSHWLVLKSWVP